MTQIQKREIQMHVLKSLNWRGARMIFPYRIGNGKYGDVIIKADDLLKIMKFKTKIK